MMRLGSVQLSCAVLPFAVFLTVAAFASEPRVETSNTPSPLYQVKEGTKVDAATLQGWKTWRAMACDRCHGPAQEGLVGPSLIEAMKRLTKEQFHQQLMKGSPEKGMPPFNMVEMVNKNWEALYAYLKGRSDGAIQPGRLTAIEQN